MQLKKIFCLKIIRKFNAQRELNFRRSLTKKKKRELVIEEKNINEKKSDTSHTQQSRDLTHPHSLKRRTKT
jgi:hypothetical protein